MSLSKVEIRKGLSSYYENFARNNLIMRLSGIKNMDTQTYIDFIQELVECGNEIMRCMSDYVRKETGFNIGSDLFELKLHIEKKRDTIWCVLCTELELRLTTLKIPIKIDGSGANKCTLSQCLGTFIEIAIGNYFNSLWAVIDTSL